MLSHEWAMGSVNSSRWKGLGPGILSSLSRYSLDNPSKFFPPCCPSKISQCCLERNTWRVRKQFLFLYLVLGGHHWDLGAVIDVAGKQIFPRESCVKKTPDLPSRGYLLQNGFVGSQSAGLWWIGFCAFGVLGDRTWDQLSSALCLSISDGGLAVWLSATQSIECLLPLEFIPLELLHSWLGYVAPYGNHLLQLLDPQCSPAPWAESRWLFKPRLENLGWGTEAPVLLDRFEQPLSFRAPHTL